VRPLAEEVPAVVAAVAVAPGVAAAVVSELVAAAETAAAVMTAAVAEAVTVVVAAAVVAVAAVAEAFAELWQDSNVAASEESGQQLEPKHFVGSEPE